MYKIRERKFQTKITTPEGKENKITIPENVWQMFFE